MFPSRPLLTYFRPDETLFQVTLEDFVHNTKPKEGDVVTFTYQSYSRYSVPIQPKIYRIREDVAWEDVVRDFASKSVQGNIFSGMCLYSYYVITNYRQ